MFCIRDSLNFPFLDISEPSIWIRQTRFLLFELMKVLYSSIPAKSLQYIVNIYFLIELFLLVQKTPGQIFRERFNWDFKCQFYFCDCCVVRSFVCEYLLGAQLVIGTWECPLFTMWSQVHDLIDYFKDIIFIWASSSRARAGKNGVFCRCFEIIDFQDWVVPIGENPTADASQKY